jgi:acyl-CoA thioesterase
LTDHVVEYRVPELPGWRTGKPSGKLSTEFWMRLKGGRVADPLSLVFLVDAAAPVVMEIGATGSSTIELTVHVRKRAAPGWLACRAGTRHVFGGYHEEDFEIWDSQGNLVAQSRQLAILRTA